jgi:DNA (cytosine-5)-methyltransferase 1
VILGPFCGVGWAEGLRALGRCEVGIDLDPAVCATRRAAGFEVVRADVATFPAGHLADKVEGLIASPPCQAFSRAGKRLGMADLPALYELVERVRRTGIWPSLDGRRWHDDRSPLVLEPLRFVGAILPAWVALEQVADVLPLWRRYAHILERWGYRTWSGVLNAADYGVPQTRERAILMASRTGVVRPPEPTHCDQRRGGSLLGLAPWVSMAEALGWGFGSTPARAVAGCIAPARRPVAGDSTGRVVLKTGNHDRAFDRSLPRPLSEPVPTIMVGHTLAQWVHERPATTVQATPRIGRPGHKDRDQGEAQFEQDAVRVTLDELAILQGFPAGYPWQGNKSQRASQIGNAVPPPLAAAIVGTLLGLDWRAAA